MRKFDEPTPPSALGVGYGLIVLGAAWGTLAGVCALLPRVGPGLAAVAAGLAVVPLTLGLALLRKKP
jgi:hypothetical protein